MARKVIQSLQHGQQIWKEENPELWLAKMEKFHAGNQKWFEELKKDPKAYQEFVTRRSESFSEWAKQHPEITLRSATIAGNATKEMYAKMKEEDPKAWNEFMNTLSERGKNGMKGYKKWQKENPEEWKEIQNRACKAAADKAIQKRKDRIKELYNKLPKSFTRLEGFEFAKANGIAYNTLMHFKDDQTVLAQTLKPRGSGRGSGGATIIYTKIYNKLPKDYEYKLYKGNNNK